MIFQNNNSCIFCCAKSKENMSNCSAPIKKSNQALSRICTINVN